MAQLRQDYLEFVAREAEVVIVGPENARMFNYFWEKEAMPFVGIPDPDHTAAGLYNQEVKLLKFGRMPAMVVIDKQGRIRYRHYGSAMSDIPPNSEVLSVLDQLNQAGDSDVQIHPVLQSHAMA